MATDLQSKKVNPTDGVLIATQVSDDVTISQRAILNGEQAWKDYEKIKHDNQERNETDAIIWNKYGDGQPFDPVALHQSGQGNRYNFPTGFMPSIVDRVTPVPVAIIDSARYLTSASLCNINYNTNEVDPEKARKSELMKERITKAIRKWPDWKTFCTGLCQELVLIGRAFAIRLDPYTPWPRFFRTDQAFLPNGTGEHSRNVQMIVAEQDLLPHELVNFIRNKAAARVAGWDIQNTVNAVNEALPKQLNEDGNPSVNQRNYEDVIREGNLGTSYEGNTVIPIAHIFAVEANDVPGESNKVTHYVIHKRGNHDVLFKKEDRFDKIEDVVTLFTLEPGNGKFYGSKGLGRKLINSHLAIERARNRMFDQLEMSGLVILSTDASRAPMVQFKVRHPFILTTTDAKFEEQVIQANVKAYIDADTMMRDLAQQRVGQYLPNAIVSDQGSREKTAREVSVDYQREAEAKVAFLSRFWGQFADQISSIQRGLLDPETNDKIAKTLQAELKELGITPDEMREFAAAPAAEVVQDLTQIQNQQIIAVSAKYGANPAINQRELMIRDISAMASPSIAESLVLPEQGTSTLLIEAARQQMMETEAIITGAPGLPVSPRDQHEIHLKVGMPDLAQGMDAAARSNIDPQALGKFAAQLTHLQGHITQWQATGGDPKLVGGYAKAINVLDQKLKGIAINAAKMMTQQQDATAEQAGQRQMQAQPPQLNADQLISIYTGADTPDEIRRQIEQVLGFTPPTPEQIAQQNAREATLKHPDLPEKIAASARQATASGTLPSAVPQDVPSGLPPGVQPPPAVPPSVTAPPPVEEPTV